MTTRVQLYKLQNQVRTEILSISEKIEKKAVRKVAIDETLKSLSNKWDEFLLNNEKLVQHGVNDDPYFRDQIFETTKELAEKAKSLLENQKLEPEISGNEGKTDGTQKQIDDGNNLQELFKKMQKQMEEQQLQMKQLQQLVQESTDKQEQGGSQKIYQNQHNLNSGNNSEAAITNMITSAKIIHFKKKIEKLEENLNEEPDYQSVYLLENLKSSWQKEIDEVKNLHWDLSVNLLIDDDIDEELASIERLYKLKLNNLLTKIISFTEEKQSIALKRINIPLFYGNVEEWSSFHDLFKKLVDENVKLAEVEKLYYLKTNLKGDALKLIQHLTITDCNYKAAWDILNQRYGNKRILFTKLVDKILDQPHINSSSAPNLKNLLDTTNECIQALKALNFKLEEADPIIARIIIRKLDKDGLLLYEQNTKKSKEIQALSDVMEFLEQHYQALEASTNKKQNYQYNNSKQQFRTLAYTGKSNCGFCKKFGHETQICKKYLALPIEERHSWVKKNQLCYNCLSHKKDKRCTSESKCEHCGLFHNTTIHFNKKENAKSSMNINSTDNVLLATAQVRVKSFYGEYVTLRALIDQGSQITTISEEAAQMLQLPRIKTDMKIHGLGNTLVGVSKSKVKIEIHPRFLSKIKIVAEALVLPALASTHPDTSFKYKVEKWKNFKLADPNFNKSERIDILIGADLFIHILKKGICHKDTILGQNTILGWILSGVIRISQPVNKRLVAMTTGIERFWEIEELSGENSIPENEHCLTRYADTTKRGEDGRFIVRLPFLDDQKLGDSRKRAMARFLSLEKRFTSDNNLKKEYFKNIEELILMNHMVKVNPERQGKYYLPHQAVVREGSITTKVRVVFDASSKTTNGKSLNDILHVGPKLQKDIFDIITKWRSWKYVISADVEKMFRQINIDIEDQEYQYILWRKNSSEPIGQYKITTIVYGTTSAPFLAVRTLREIGNHCNEEDIKQRINEDFYMDDLLTGADTIQECKEVQKEISHQLQNFGFHLRKWISNNEEILKSINSNEKNEVLDIQEDEYLKTLGLQWNPSNDCFSFKMHLINEQPVTKRRALSHLARIFDPLGWLTPITVTAKLFIQHLWKIQSDWDEPLNAGLAHEWQKFTQHLSTLTAIKINRWIGDTNESSIQLHGFADASEKAYAAVVYVKINSSIAIVAAKSKVNPIKNKKTLPKLELCAAHLLAKLLSRVQAIFKPNLIYAWSDSMITLAWIKSPKNKDKFIRTRVSEISSVVPIAKWGYVKSKENPADLGSRGIPPEKLVGETLWWNGPQWLLDSEENWPTDQPKKVFVNTMITTQRCNYLYEITKKFSSFNKIKRIFAYMLRFIKKLKGNKSQNTYLTTDELHAAEIVIIKSHQEAEWPNELKQLKKFSFVDHRSKLASLNPNLDSNGVMRVGGRLQFSSLNYQEKHPIILNKSPLAESIIEEIHKNTLHGGNRLIENIVRRKFWILGVKNSIKKCIRRCTKCTRYRKETAHQLMGALPRYRVNISQPFDHCGIDYAGPLQMKCSNGRGQKSFKGYVAVFVCMTTKAVHLEAVSSLTTEAFHAALRRFFARRGKSSHIYSDNGTNFVGAAKQLDKDFIAAIKSNSAIAPVLAEDKIEWHFIPPASPHFGGIWEAAVKSMKYHLRRIIGENKLTYEEMSTLLAQIEAILNSRPLHELRSTPDGLEVLTPGHFLIGRPMIECPENKEENKISCLDRWKLLQKLKTHFWKQWKVEYLSSLQQRLKWKTKNINIQKGQIVIIKNEDAHPARWPLGRVVEVHPGKDGLVRVVTLKTENGVLKRPIHKLCPFEPHTAEDVEENNSQPNFEEESPRSARTNNTRTRSVLRSPFTFLFTMLFMCVLSARATEPSNIRVINNNTAIYLDPISQINVVSSSWNLIVYYEMNTYFDALAEATELINKSRRICPKLETFEDQCWAVLRNMENQVDRIKTNNDLLLNKQPRNKRDAPLKFVGSLYHIIFGLMDEDDRQSFEENMENLLANQHDLKALVKKQTSVVDSTVNLLKTTTDEVNSHFKDIKNKIENISLTVETNYFIYRESVRFFIVTKQLDDLINNCNEIQKEAIDLLLDINHGKVHPALISPQQLHEEIIKIRDSLPDKFVLPGRHTGTELKEIWHLLTGSGIFAGTKLIIDLKIPLFNRQVSQFYKIIPVPMVRNGMVMVAHIQAPYLVYNYELDSYHYLTQTLINDCKKTINNQIVCEENFPWIDASTNHCELSPLKPHNKLNCSYDEIEKNPFWVELRTKGNWLFKIFSNTSAHVKCSNQEQTIIQLPQQGIFTLDADCTARIDKITLMAVHDIKGKYSDQFRTFLTKDVDLEEVNFIKPLGNVIINHNKEIAELKDHVENLKQVDIKLRGVTFHHLSGHTSLILVVIVIIILIFTFIKKILKSRQIASITFAGPQNVQI